MIKIISYASVSNVGCGFDILGFATEIISDEIQLALNDTGIIKITKVDGPGDIPTDPGKNAVGAALKAFLTQLKSNAGFDIQISKKIMPGSGLGSSAASSAAIVAGANYLFGHPFSDIQLVDFAMEGERLISGAIHADNVAPAVLGGITLIRAYNPTDIIQLPVPEDLYCIALHPQIEIKTKEARGILKKEIDMKMAVKQWGNVAGLISGLYLSDYELIRRSVTDHIIEPQRAGLIPGFYRLKEAAFQSGALGCSISGSGPTVFALAKGRQSAEKIKQSMENQYLSEEIPFQAYLTKINPKGAHII